MAGWLSECLPVAHFLRLARDVMLKGSTLADMGHEMGPTWPRSLSW